MKKIVSATLVMALSISMLTPVFAGVQAENTAQFLYNKGILAGTGNDEEGNPVFNLDRKATRQEAATLLVMLMGKKDEALAAKIDIPFTDVSDWAAPYVSFAYNNGLVAGFGDTVFGAETEIQQAQYLTMVLNALGYNAGDDFLWRESAYLAKDIGLIDEITDKPFLREDIVLISHRALYTRIKNSDITLAEALGLGLSDEKYTTSTELITVIKGRYGFDIEFDSTIADEATKFFILNIFYEYCKNAVPDTIMRDFAKSRKTLMFTVGGEASIGSKTAKIPVYTYKIDSDFKKSKTVELITAGIPEVIGKFYVEKHWRNIPDEIDSEMEKLLSKFIFLYDVKFENDTITLKENHAHRAMLSYNTHGNDKGVFYVDKKLVLAYETLCETYDLTESEKHMVDPYSYSDYR